MGRRSYFTLCITHKGPTTEASEALGYISLHVCIARDIGGRYIVWHVERFSIMSISLMYLHESNKSACMGRAQE